MTDLAMHDITDYPTGNRPLIIGDRRKRSVLTPLVADIDLPCFYEQWSAKHAITYPGCLGTITAGSHYLRHATTGVANTFNDRTFDYCAPCAVRELSCYGVREAIA